MTYEIATDADLVPLRHFMTVERHGTRPILVERIINRMDVAEDVLVRIHYIAISVLDDSEACRQIAALSRAEASKQ